jgi:hypothetical protein
MGFALHFFDMAHIHQLLASYGYWAVLVVVMMESAGIPVPGETVLVSAAIYAGTTHNMRIELVILAAACGAIMGDNIGFWVGREFGQPILTRYGSYIGLDEKRLKPRRQDRLLRPLRRLSARLRGAARRRQPAAATAVLCVQRRRRHRLGEPVRDRRLCAR